MKKIIFLLIAGILVWGGSSLCLISNALAGENQNIKVEFQQIGQSSSILEEDFQVPVIKGWQNKKAEAEINNKFFKVVSNFKKEMELVAQEAKKGHESLGYPTGKYQAITEGKVLYNKNDLLAISLNYYQYTGGAHGISYQEVFNIDLRSGNILSLQDIFKPGSNYKRIIDREIKHQISRNPENFFPEGEGGFQTISNKQSFLLKDNYLIFYFQPYEIACYAAGIVEFKIPFSKLKKTVKERFISK